jgi:hypothetical protein
METSSTLDTDAILQNYRASIRHIIGDAFEVYNEYRGGLLESAYEAALCYLLNPTCSLCQCNFLILKYRFF